MRDLNPLEFAVLPLRKYADFSGRAPRAEYWWFYLGSVILNFLAGLLDGALGTSEIISGAVSLALLLPSLAVTVRRLHDTDRSGWWLLAFVAVFGVIGAMAVLGGPSLGQSFGSTAGMFTFMMVAVLAMLAVGITMLVFMVQEGTEGENRYGSDPYGPDNLEQVFA
jgi:uncharacterized membrane protein YhaH (DUF805 family)